MSPLSPAISLRRYGIVTGAAGGLGRALALRLARDGWHLALCDVDEIGAAETQALVESLGGTAQVERLDVTLLEEWEALRDSLQADWPRLDLLVNNAGVCGGGDVDQFPLEDWRWLLGVNLYGVIYGCHTLLPWMKANPQRTHIINTASIAGLIAAPCMGAYNVAKAGVVALSETMYGELRKKNIGVTVVCPGFFATGLLAGGRFVRPQFRTVADRYMQSANFTANDVANSAVRAIGTSKLYVVLNARARWLWRLRRWLPMGFIRLAAFGYEREFGMFKTNEKEAEPPQESNPETAVQNETPVEFGGPSTA